MYLSEVESVRCYSRLPRVAAPSTCCCWLVPAFIMKSVAVLLAAVLGLCFGAPRDPELALRTGECRDHTMILWYHSPSPNCNKMKRAAFVIPRVKEPGLESGYMGRTRVDSDCNTIYLSKLKANNGCWLTYASFVGGKPYAIQYTVKDITGNATVEMHNMSRILVLEGGELRMCGKDASSASISEWEFQSSNEHASTVFVLQLYRDMGNPIVYANYKSRTHYNATSNCVTIRDVSPADSGLYTNTLDLQQNSKTGFYVVVIPGLTQEDQKIEETTYKTGGGLVSRQPGEFPVWLPIVLIMLLLLMVAITFWFRRMLCTSDSTDSESMDRSSEENVTVHILRGDFD